MTDVDLESLGLPRDFYSGPVARGLAWDVFYGAAVRLGDPPDFSYEQYRGHIEWDAFHSEFDLINALQRLYKETDIMQIYEEVSPYYDAVIAQYEREAYPVLNEMVDHFNIDLSQARSMRLFVNLLDSAEFGATLLGEDPLDPDFPIVMYSGPVPDGSANVPNAVHEFSHVFISPVVRSSRRVASPVDYLKAELGSPSYPSYRTWEVIIDESFVRAFTAYFMGRNRQIAASEAFAGFIMTTFIYDNIERFYEFGDTFEEFVDGVVLKYHSQYDPSLGGDDEGEDEEPAEIDDSIYYLHPTSGAQVGRDKVWTIRFNQNVSPADLDVIVVEKDSMRMLDVITTVQDDTVIVECGEYRVGSTYRMYITAAVSENGRSINNPTVFEFTVK